MNKLLTIMLLSLSLCNCSSDSYQPQDCDLIFQIAGTTNFSKAITDATAHRDNVKLDHVGLIFTENDTTKVIEASAKHGVEITTLKEFIGKAVAGYVIKRASVAFASSDIIQRAKTHLGKPYDWSFRPDNGKMYCSELIYECFRNLKGERIFHAQPMNFRDENGNMPQFWTDMFQNLGETIPEGVDGTNPNDLSKEAVLEEVFRFIPE